MTESYAALTEEEKQLNTLNDRDLISNKEFSLEEFWKSLSLNHITIKYLYSLNIGQYTKSLENLEEKGGVSFEVRTKYIRKYIKWYFSLTESSFLNRIIQKKNFLFRRVILSPDGEKIAYLDYDRTLFIYNFQKKKFLFQINQKNIQETKGIKFSNDSKKLAFYDDDEKFIKVWILEKMESQYKYQGNPFFMTFSKENDYLGVIMETTGLITIYEKYGILSETDKFPEAFIIEFPHETLDFICIADGSYLHIWDYIKKTTLLTQDVEGLITSVHFLLSNERLMVTAKDNSIVFWRFRKAPEQVNKIQGRRGNIFEKMMPQPIEVTSEKKNFKCAFISSNDQYIFAYGESENDSTKKIYVYGFERRKYKLLKTFNKERVSSEICIENKFIMVGYDGSITIIDAAKIEKISNKKFSLGGKTHFLAYSSDCQLVAKFFLNKLNIYRTDKDYHILHETPDENDRPYQIEIDKERIAKIIVFNHNNSEISLAFKEEIFIYTLKLNKLSPVSHELKYKEFVKNITTMVYSEQGILFYGTFFGDIYMFPLNEKNPKIFLRNHDCKVTVLSIDSQEFQMASGDQKGVVVFWNIVTSKIVGSPIVNGNDKIINVVFQNKQSKVIIGSSKGSFWIIDKLNQFILETFSIQIQNNFGSLYENYNDEYDKKDNNEENNENDSEEKKEPSAPYSFCLSYNDEKLAISHNCGILSVWSLEKDHIGEHLGNHSFYSFAKNIDIFSRVDIEDTKNEDKPELYSININFKKNSSNILIAKSQECYKTLNIDPYKISYKIEDTLPKILTDNEKLISVNTDKDTIKVIDSKTGNIFREFKQTQGKKIRNLFLLHDNILFSADFDCIFLWDLIKGEKIDKFPYKSENDDNGFFVARSKLKLSDKAIVAQGVGKFYLWKMGNNKFLDAPIKSLINMGLSDITNIDLSYDDSRLLVEISYEKIYVFHKMKGIDDDWMTWEKKGDELVSKYESYINRLFLSMFSSVDYKIYSLMNSEQNGDNYYILEWSENGSYQEIQCPKSTKIMIEPKEKNLLILTEDKRLQMVSLQNKIVYQITDYDLNHKLENCFINKNNDLYLCFKDSIEIYFNAFDNPILFLNKKNKLKSLFFFKDKEPINFEGIINTTIFPFNYNFLQILAYYKDFHYLYQELFLILSNNKIEIPFNFFFEKDIHKNNCFDIAFKSKDSKLFKNFLYCLKKYKINKIPEDYRKYLNSLFFKNLFLMFEDQTKVIDDFLNIVFCDPIDFPSNVAFPKLQNPIVETSEKPCLSWDEVDEILKNQKSEANFFKMVKIIPEKRNESQLNEIIKAKCFYPYDLLDYKNQTTLQIFKVISNFEPTNQIFNNDAIRRIVSYKWRKYAKTVFIIEALGFILFLILYIINADLILVARIENEGTFYSSISIVFDILILIFVLKHIATEIAQIYYLSWKDYRSSLWNLNDIFYITFALVSTVLDILSCLDIFNDYPILKAMQATTIFLAFFRLLSYARGIEGSSFMIKLIIQVIYDIRYFLLIMFIFILSLACSVFILQTNYEYDGFDTFIIFFREMIGDIGQLDDLYGEVEYTRMLYVFFFIATLVLYITMLNLLIAIISDTFTRVKNTEQFTKIWEKWNIVTEIDAMMSYILWLNPLKSYFVIPEKKTPYLFFLYNERHTETEITEIGQLQFEINQVKVKIDNIEDKFKQSFEQISSDNITIKNSLNKILEIFNPPKRNITLK